MRKIYVLLLLVAGLAVGGCGITSLESGFKANRYFSSGDFDQGVSDFSEKIREDPDSATDHYYLGRFYLAQKRVDDALVHLRRAVALDDDDADYQFWLGVAAGAAGDNREERLRYEKTLKLRSHAKARLYMAHLQLREGQVQPALELYDKILEDYPYNAAALYNRALALKFTGQQDEEKKAWRRYLNYYPSGYLAARAADHLNSLGDFSYRNHQFGYRTVTLTEIGFDRGRLNFEARSSMKLVGAILTNMTEGDLQITTFVTGDNETARRRAMNLKRFLLKEYPRLESERIKLSWFSQPETLFGPGNEFRLNQSVRMYLTDWQSAKTTTALQTLRLSRGRNGRLPIPF